MSFICINLLVFYLQFSYSQQIIFLPNDDLAVNFTHLWNKPDETVTISFDISNSSMINYRYYYFDFRPFATHDHTEYFSRQRLIDTHNSLHIVGLHENDYVACVSFIDEYENFFKPRSTCYEFTLGEKIVGSHHGGSSGYLAPLLLAFAFVIHVFIAIVHHIKAKNYGPKLLERFINVNPKTTRRILHVKNSLKQLDLPRLSASVQRRLSRVSIDADEKKSNDEIPLYTLPSHHRRISLSLMKTIPEHHA